MPINKKRTGKVYLTKRALVSAAKKGVRKAVAETISVMGYNVVAENGWVVKKYVDGRTERITEIEAVSRPTKIILH